MEEYKIKVYMVKIVTVTMKLAAYIYFYDSTQIEKNQHIISVIIF